MSEASEELKQELKQTYFRLRPDDVEKFRQACIELGFSQADGFEYLLRTLDLENAKNAAPGRADEIDQFRHMAYALVDMFSQSIEYSLQADSKARDAVDRSMKAKDKTIADLQEQNGRLEERLTSLKSDMATNEMARKAAVKENEETESKLRTAQLTIYDKNQMIDMLQKERDSYSAKASLYDEIKGKYDTLLEESRTAKLTAEKEKNEAIQQIRSELQAVIDSKTTALTESRLREQDLASQLALAQKENVMIKALAEAELRAVYEAEIKALREKYEAEANELRQKLDQRTEELLSAKNKGGK